MTWEQIATVFRILSRRRGWLHHGDCIGADHHAHGIAREAWLSVAIHPPANPDKRAWCIGDHTWMPKPYLDRNHDIVDATVGLIAAPGEFKEQFRSGTWATVRYARKVGKPVVLVLPDGGVRRGGVGE
jgi:hypothetical protein